MSALISRAVLFFLLLLAHSFLLYIYIFVDFWDLLILVLPWMG